MQRLRHKQKPRTAKRLKPRIQGEGAWQTRPKRKGGQRSASAGLHGPWRGWTQRSGKGESGLLRPVRMPSLATRGRWIEGDGWSEARLEVLLQGLLFPVPGHWPKFIFSSKDRLTFFLLLLFHRSSQTSKRRCRESHTVIDETWYVGGAFLGVKLQYSMSWRL